LYEEAAMEVALEEKSLPLLWLVDLTLKAAGRRMVFAFVVPIINLCTEQDGPKGLSINIC